MKSGKPFREVIIAVWVRDEVTLSRGDSGGGEPWTNLRYIWREPSGLDGLHILGLLRGEGEGKNQQLVLEFWLKQRVDYEHAIGVGKGKKKKDLIMMQFTRIFKTREEV